jgi:hypothetical protein
MGHQKTTPYLNKFGECCHPKKSAYLGAEWINGELHEGPSLPLTLPSRNLPAEGKTNDLIMGAPTQNSGWRDLVEDVEQGYETEAERGRESSR